MSSLLLSDTIPAHLDRLSTVIGVIVLYVPTSSVLAEYYDYSTRHVTLRLCEGMCKWIRPLYSLKQLSVVALQ